MTAARFNPCELHFKEIAKMADITWSTADEQRTVVFSASTPKGEEWMGLPEVKTTAGMEASRYIAAAQKVGLTIVPGP